jgi:acetyl-CoA synthetase
MTPTPRPDRRPALAPGRDWDAMRAAFRWPTPARMNMARDLCGRWAQTTPDRAALVHVGADGSRRAVTHRALWRDSGRLANALAAHGAGRGDRVAVLLPQGPEALLAHLAAWRLGAVSAPLSVLFGAEALAYRLSDMGAVAVVTDAANLPKVADLRAGLPALRLILCADGPRAGAPGLAATLARAADGGACADTGPEDPALLSYTSGTTGAPKGALHAHRVLTGHLPGVRLVHDFAPVPGDRFWTPADWAWMGGLCNVMMPALAWGAPLVSHRMEKFDPEAALRLIARERIANVFLPPTALRLMRAAPDPRRWVGTLRTVGSGGEALGAETLDWGREALGLTVHEFYGQTECNMVLTNNAAVFPVRPGSMGRAVPGYDLCVLDGEGRPLPAGETGEIAVRRGGGAMFLEYLNKPDKTVEKFAGDWMRTGDEGRIDAEGYVYFASRTDDVITSSGYRIGPTEIEDCLSAHPAVSLAAVVGLPDPVRTEAVTAFVTLRPGAAPDAGLAEALTTLVRGRLGAHLAPRSVRFVDALPTTTTGKLMRREVKRRALEGA